jgi:hypothetical protein
MKFTLAIGALATFLIVIVGVVMPCILGCGRGPALFPICGCG